MNDDDLPGWVVLLGILVGFAALIGAGWLVYSWWGWGGLILSLIFPVVEFIGYLGFMAVMLPVGLAVAAVRARRT